MCFGCSKELSHCDGSFEYPQHIFWLRNKKNNFQLRTFIWGPEVSMLEISKTSECKIWNIFLSISLNMCYGCSKERSHRDCSFEHPQHMFWLRNKKNNCVAPKVSMLELNKTSERIENIFLSICYNICFGCSKELSH